ncbi:MAG: hypothetical protein ACKVS6_13930 [Planctomycetota bacterium]
MLRLLNTTNNRVSVARAQRASVRGLTGFVSPSAAVVQARFV